MGTKRVLSGCARSVWGDDLDKEQPFQ